MEFRLKADATFEADNIDDALKKLGQHFLGISQEGLDEPDIIESGEINILRIDKNDAGKDSFVELLALEV